MASLMRKLWNDDAGALIASEWLFMATLLTIGIIVGLTNVRNAVNAELSEFANALLALSQGYIISGTSGCGGSTDGSQAIDLVGTVDFSQTVPAAPAVIEVSPCP